MNDEFDEPRESEGWPFVSLLQMLDGVFAWVAFVVIGLLLMPLLSWVDSLLLQILYYFFHPGPF